MEVEVKLSVRRCPQCHDWSKCTGYSYFTPSEVDGHWCWHQVIFLLLARECLALFTWPTEPSDYVSQGKGAIKAAASFEGSLAVVCGEFNRRWANFTKSDQASKDIGTLDAEIFAGLNLRTLSPAARSVVAYFIKPRRMLYHDWINQQWRRNEAPSNQSLLVIRHKFDKSGMGMIK